MRLSIFGTMALCLGLALSPGCSEEETPSGGKGGSGGGGTGGAGTGGTGTGGATGSGGSGADAAGETGGATVTYAMVQPIFKTKCAPCHTTGGNTKFPESYENTTKTVITGGTDCGTGAKVGPCTIVRIKKGTMPYNKMCKTATPPMPNECVTPAEEALIQSWVDQGAKE